MDNLDITTQRKKKNRRSQGREEGKRRTKGTEVECRERTRKKKRRGVRHKVEREKRGMEENGE